MTSTEMAARPWPARSRSSGRWRRDLPALHHTDRLLCRLRSKPVPPLPPVWDVHEGATLERFAPSPKGEGCDSISGDVLGALAPGEAVRFGDAPAVGR